MAAISITPANVLGSSLAERWSQYKSAAAITAGDYVYLNSSSQWAKVDSDAGLGTGANDIRGFAENSAPGAGQPLTVIVADPSYTPGGTLQNGLAVYAFTTAGAISFADIPTTAARPIVAGLASSTTTMVVPRFGVATGVVI
jgi:hypothetical protein